MKKVLICAAATCLFAQAAIANDFDDVDDVQQAIGSAIGSVTANAANAANAAAGVNISNNVTLGSPVAGGGNNAGTATGANAAAGAGNTNQLVALNGSQLAALGIQTNITPATGGASALAGTAAQPNGPALIAVSTVAGGSSVNALFAANPTASGGISTAAHIAASAAAIMVADSDEYNYNEEE